MDRNYIFPSEAKIDIFPPKYNHTYLVFSGFIVIKNELKLLGMIVEDMREKRAIIFSLLLLFFSEQSKL